MKRRNLRPVVAAVALAFGALVVSGPASAGLLAHFDHSYLGGAVEIDLDVYSGAPDAPAGKYLWKYTVTNISYDPTPGSSNGFSGFELFLPSPIPEIADITDPAPGWEHNCCSGLPQEWDIRNSNGLGIMPGQTGIFSFTTDPRLVAINDAGWFHSWVSDLQTSTNPTVGMHVPLVPGLVPIATPAPGTVLLLGLGIAALAWMRTRYPV